MEYNGWVNYETWAYKLYLDQNQELKDSWIDRVRKVHWEIAPNGDENATRWIIAGELKEENDDRIEEIKSLVTWNLDEHSNVLLGFVETAFSQVHWEDVARSLCADADIQNSSGQNTAE